MRLIKFANSQHEKFFNLMLQKGGNNDSYHKAFFYTATISSESRNHIDDLFNFAEDCIRINGLDKAWQTSGTLKQTRLAFNLWNGWTEKENEKLSSAGELFDCEYSNYFVEAIRLRYPEYYRNEQHRTLDTER